MRAELWTMSTRTLVKTGHTSRWYQYTILTRALQVQGILPRGSLSLPRMSSENLEEVPRIWEGEGSRRSEILNPVNNDHWVAISPRGGIRRVSSRVLEDDFVAMFLGGFSVTAHVWMCLLEPSSEQPWVSNYQVVIITVFCSFDFPAFSDFLGRLHPRRTRLQKPPNALGVEESSSPRRVLHF